MIEARTADDRRLLNAGSAEYRGYSCGRSPQGDADWVGGWIWPPGPLCSMAATYAETDVARPPYG